MSSRDASLTSLVTCPRDAGNQRPSNRTHACVRYSPYTIMYSGMWASRSVQVPDGYFCRTVGCIARGTLTAAPRTTAMPYENTLQLLPGLFICDRLTPPSRIWTPTSAAKHTAP